MNTAVVVINWESGGLLQRCIESLLATTPGVEILIIDNNSRDSSVDFITDFRGRFRYIGNGGNHGFAAAVNQGFKETSAPYVLILNPDVQVLPGAVQSLEDFMESHPWAGAAGGYVGDKYLPKPFPTVGSLIRENLGLASPAGRGRRVAAAAPIQVDQPAAAALIIRREAYEHTGPFDEQFYPAWYEDVDYCLRMKEWCGWKIYFVPAAEFIHTGGYSAEALGSDKFLRAYYHNQVRFAQKHLGTPGTIAIRASMAAGVIGRVIGKPRWAIPYMKVLIGALFGW